MQHNKRSAVIALSENLDEWIERGRKNFNQPDALVSRHQQIIEALMRNLDEQQRLLDILRTQRRRTVTARHSTKKEST